MLALALLVLGLLPIANVIVGGHEAPWYREVLAEWTNGTLLTVGFGVILALLSRRTPLWREGLASRIANSATRHSVATGAALGIVALALYAAISTFVFDRRPLLVDEVVQLIQSRIFAEGRLFRPTDIDPAFFSVLNVVDMPERWFGQFPPGGPAMLLPGVLVGAPWLVGPICGAVSAAAFWWVVRTVEPDPATALGGVLLFAFAPFTVFMAGSFMNHVPTLMWNVLAMLALVRLTLKPHGHRRVAFALGFCLGAMASIRPVDAAAAALPAAGWLVWRAFQSRPLWRDVASAGLGVALPGLAVAYFNMRTTGSPWRFGYEQLWGPSHALGFHAAPWGMAHTPAHGVELLSLYILRLQTYLFETPIPSLTVAIIGLLLVGRRTFFDRYLLCSTVLLLLGYFAYWHDGFYLGPRFMYDLLPWLALGTARGFHAIIRRLGPGTLAARVVVFTGISAAVIAGGINVPIRIRQYATQLQPMRLDYAGPSKRAGIQNAIIFVRESWGAQLVARMWAAGISRTETELLYRSVDSCRLEEVLADIERAEIRGAAVAARLEPLLRDSARVIRSTLSPDQSERMLPGEAYSSRCQAHLSEDRAGFAVFAPALAMPTGTNIYARDLQERNAGLMRRNPGRRAYLLRPVNASPGAPLGLQPLAADGTLGSSSVALVRP